MTEVLSSKDYRHNARQIDFTQLASTSANVDTDEPPFTIHSPLVDHINRECARSARNAGKHRTRRQQDIGGNEQEQAQLSVLALLLAAVRRSGLTCQTPQEDVKMEIGWPTNVRHVTHVTFDRVNGFLGLPVEFELEIPRRVPSASASVFGVSSESMQCSFDGRGNSIPTILLLLQERLYDQGGLNAEGIFRINPENSKEEHVRDQLNRGIVPADMDVHCLAGLIKAWLRELPKGVLDSLTPEQLMLCQSEEQCLELVKQLPPTQAALLGWAVNLMADVVQKEQFNKMNARNVATVFAPNMTQMSDPLTALMHAVQVMNFLKTLILKTLRDREIVSTGCMTGISCGGPLCEDQQDGTKKASHVSMSFRKDATQVSTENLYYSNNALLNGGIERKGTNQEKAILDVEERFLRGFSGRDTAEDLINNSRIPLSNKQASPCFSSVTNASGPLPGKARNKGGKSIVKIDGLRNRVEAW